MTTLTTSAPVTSLSVCNSLLALGTENGQVAVYDLADPKDAATPRNIYRSAEEIASLSWVPFKQDATHRDLWMTSGSQLRRLDVAERLADPVSYETISPIRDPDDVISKTTVSDGGTHLGYATDEGEVGVISLLPDRRKTVMRTSHTSICDCVTFLPSAYPWQLISAGYDYRILHHDHSRGTLSSELSLEAATTSEATLSLSPPFIHSMHLSSTGGLACGLGTGEVYLSAVTVSPPKSGKKRKWLGLDGHGGCYQAAEGPVVGVQHMGEDRLLVCSLLGNLMLFETRPVWRLLRSLKLEGVEKVNAMTCDEQHLILAGVNTEGKGVVEILSRDEWR